MERILVKKTVENHLYFSDLDDYSIEKAVELFQELAKSHPGSKISIECYDSTKFSLYVLEPESDAQYQFRLKQASDFENREREQYERLKAKYG